MSEDNWKHRGQGMRCNSCMWFAEKVATVEQNADRDRTSFGRCRRHAPTLAGWPAVFGTDWCGDHKLDENKI